MSESTLEQLKNTARDLAGHLFSAECVQCNEQKVGRPSCLQAEEKRPLSKEEKAAGWVVRPFFGYRTERMCGPCQAYYHAERAAQELHNLHCWDVRIKADAARRRKPAELPDDGPAGTASKRDPLGDVFFDPPAHPA
jgi:hypothetical protein